MKRLVLGSDLASLMGSSGLMANELKEWQENLLVEEADARDSIIVLLDFLGSQNYYLISDKEAESILDHIKELIDYDAVLIRKIRTFRQ